MTLSDALDRLYASPLEGFVAARRAIAAELNAHGELGMAQAVAAAAKPSRTAWALNQVARRHPERVRAVFDARDAAVVAQKAGSADELRSATREYRARVAEVVRDVRSVLEGAGAQASAVQLRRVSETIQAASADDAELRAQFAGGRLVKDVELEDPFAGLGVAPPARVASPKKGEDAAARRAAERTQEEQRRASERERERRKVAWARASQRVAQLEEEARNTRAAARQAETSAARAEDEARRARRAADEVQARLDKAREEERALRGT